jgi:hypothetical protein
MLHANPVTFPIIYRHPVRIYLGCGVKGAGIKEEFILGVETLKHLR